MNDGLELWRELWRDCGAAGAGTEAVVVDVYAEGEGDTDSARGSGGSLDGV